MTRWSDFIRDLGTSGPPTLQGIYALGFALRSEVVTLLGKFLRVDEAQTFSGGEKAQGRANLGLGTMATQDADDVAITGGAADGLTITGSTITGYQPSSVSLTSLAALNIAANQLAYGNGANSWALTSLTAFARSILDDVDAAAVRATIGALPDTAANLLDATFAPSAAPTKRATFNNTAVTAGQTRALIMPDRDVNLGALAVDLITSIDLTGGASGIGVLTNLATLGYRQYKIEVLNAVPATGAVDMYLENSTNNGGAYGATSDVNWGRMQQTTAATTLTGLNAGGDTKGIMANNIANTANLSGFNGEITLTLNSAGRCRASFDAMGHTGSTEFYARGAAFFAAASNAFRIRPSSGGWTSGQINLYGIR